uniref:adaptin ear-binding coat-associated protein 2 n=1 Tax=Lonchura striata TaxID=40157 RepID=UPI000B4DC43A|nr:adaptin ear-binding coat-associated protein 2 [Lonchura striata domestica]
MDSCIRMLPSPVSDPQPVLAPPPVPGSSAEREPKPPAQRCLLPARAQQLFGVKRAKRGKHQRPHGEQGRQGSGSRSLPFPRAAEWQLDQPAWSGRLRITAKGSTAFIKLEDKVSGEGDGGDGGVRWVRQQSELARQAQDLEQGPKLDLGFKEGQTIKLNIANMKKKEGGTGSSRPRPAGLGGLSLLPPPPGGKSSSGERPAPLSTPAQLPGTPITDSLLSWPQPTAAPAADVWGDFAQASGSSSNQAQGNTGWVQF